ncbi:MAG: hypothetical protein A2498_11160 [Lentisphaerae bacterium RIFOXYC12_FULL_60_16]|nr:MAG: hypothetical protein A2498_11160 [Lentisphaerae bacterium RIFOXYC12_FULL_60_16]
MTPPSIPGFHAIPVARQNLTEWFLTSTPVAGEPADAVFLRVDRFFADHPGIHILRQTVFGTGETPGSQPASDPPVSRVGCPGHQQPLAGILIHGVEGCSVEPILINGVRVGSIFTDTSSRIACLCGITPRNPHQPPELQAADAFATMDAALAAAGMSFTEVFRTWWFLRDILDWYGEFNRARHDAFAARSIRSYPASTGVGMSHTAPVALVAELMAIRPLPGSKVRITPVDSPLQGPPAAYGSAFSRAVEITTPDTQRLTISGTASIAPGGATIHVGDLQGQVKQTLAVVQAILESRHMQWTDVVRAIAYVKPGVGFPAPDKTGRIPDLPAIPLVLTRGTICRPDLLFELEVEAVSNRK